MCFICSKMGHFLESCPQDTNKILGLTNCRMYHMGQTNDSANKTKPGGTKVDQLLDHFQKSAPSTPTKSLPPPIQEEQLLNISNPDDTTNTAEGPPGPVMVTQPKEDNAETAGPKPEKFHWWYNKGTTRKRINDRRDNNQTRKTVRH